MLAADDRGMIFREEADTFALIATFQDDKLKIKLKDFVHWAIYEKEYSEDDIGRVINRKMDVIDVYSALAQSKVECDEDTIKEKETGARSLRHY